MNDDDIYDSDFDSNFEDLVNTGKDIQVAFFDNIEQFKQSEKDSIKSVVSTTIRTSFNTS